ncbi:alpha/beta fold hydrolase [Nocardia caishijiensis]|uniref:Thioesterase domain-containing protein n=1 Tax=Nocardia caishijiensis TaxID=184756 RepID=A0ABQ6YQI2_9NOCA|nr:alpha/beta fold hydrolase [Nocardia caishijiensis]KAF0847820.1 thioesterase domain-containing protein [Nocardia caishijiensis]
MRTDEEQAGTCEWSREVYAEARPTAALSTVLPIRPRADRVDGTPLFCVAGEAGLAWPFAGLLAHLAPEIPVYGLQTVVSLPTIEEYARHFLAEIRRIVPTGPYQLLGWSVGGLVAQEMAVRLREDEQVVRVVLLGSDLDAGQLTTTTPRRFTERLIVDEEGGAPNSETDTIATDTIATDFADSLARTIAMTGAELRNLIDHADALTRAAATHRPQHLPGELVLVVPERDRPDADAALRNRRRFGPVRGHAVDATLDDLLAPEVLALVADLLTV